MHFAILAAAVTILSATETPAPNVVPPDDLRVIQAVVVAHSTNHRPFAGKAVLLDRTRGGAPVFRDALPELTPDRSESLLSAYLVRNSSRYEIDDEELPVTLADAGAYSQSDDTPDWNALERDFPGVMEVLAVSMPAHDEQGRAAIVEIEARMRDRRSVALYYLEKKAGAWTEKAYVSIPE